MEKRILHLTLKKEWFEMIAIGDKREEYREIKDYWKYRLCQGSKFKGFDEIHFRNGYSKEAPFMRVKFYNTEIGNTEPRWSGGKQECCYIINLGEVLEIKNTGGGECFQCHENFEDGLIHGLCILCNRSLPF